MASILWPLFLLSPSTVEKSRLVVAILLVLLDQTNINGMAIKESQASHQFILEYKSLNYILLQADSSDRNFVPVSDSKGR